MEPSLFLKNQEMPLKKSFSLRTLFNLFFVISLGLNVYFLVVQGGASSVDIVYATGVEEDKSVEVQMASLNTKPVDSEMAIPVHEKEPVLTSKPTNEAPVHEVKKVSFDPSAKPAGRNIQALQLKVRNSLNYAVCQEMAKSECGSFAAHLARLLAWFMDVNRNMRNGDVLNVVYERLDNEDQFKVLQLTYKSGYLKKTLDANFYKGDGMKYGGYFDRNGKEIAKRIAEKQTPIAEYIEITSLPGDFRKGRRGHSGTDFKAEVGTPIRASFEGRVRRTSWNVRANGYCIELDHPREGVITRYLHLSRVLVKRGQYVKQGEVIAESGNTGRTFAPHLHYEVRSRDKKKTVYNPFDFKYHKSYHRNIPSHEVKEFQAVVSAYDALLQDNGVGVKIQAG